MAEVECREASREAWQRVDDELCALASFFALVDPGDVADSAAVRSELARRVDAAFLGGRLLDGLQAAIDAVRRLEVPR